MTFRAAYWYNEGTGAEVLLTLPEHAGLTDEQLLAEAGAYAERIGMNLSCGEIVIGEWDEGDVRQADWSARQREEARADARRTRRNH